jgi:Beta-lactamase
LPAEATVARDAHRAGPIVAGGLILTVKDGTIAEVSTALRELLIRHVDAGTIPGAVALLGAGNVEVVTAGVASIGGGPMATDAIMRIQSMTKVITSVHHPSPPPDQYLRVRHGDPGFATAAGDGRERHRGWPGATGDGR